MNLLRILYHNVLGYNLDKFPVNDCANTMLAIYQQYQPDILCLQEMTAGFRSDENSQNLMIWLNQNYTELCFEEHGIALENDGGTPTPIFVRKDSGLKVVESGYIRAREKATKGTTWAILEDASGKRFCVSNSHFVSPTEQGADTDYLKMRTYRTADTTVWLNKLALLLTDHPELPFFSGGDFNTGRHYLNPGEEPTPWELYVQQGYKDIRSNDNDSIDHALCMGNITVISYHVILGNESVWGSDHAPHYADLIVN